MKDILQLHQRVVAPLERIPYSVLALAARVFPSAVFWMSGETKRDGWHLADSAVYLFQEEYKLPLLDPTVAATLALIGEHLFPALLVLGLGSRFAALGLLGMTAVIEFFVYPGAWPTHGTWAACFLLILARGPGAISLDHLLAKRLRSRARFATA